MSELDGSAAGRMSGRTRFKAAQAEPAIVTRNGKPISVILPIATYEELLKRVDDAQNFAWLKEARTKPIRYRPLCGYRVDRKTRV